MKRHRPIPGPGGVPVTPVPANIPEGYDRYELKIHKQASGLFREWVDAVLFAQHDDVTTKDARTKRVRGVSTGSRVLQTRHHASYDAGNRYGLPETLPLDWEEFAAAVAAGRPVSAEALLEDINNRLSLFDAERQTKIRSAVERAKGNANELARINNHMNALLQGEEGSK